MPVCRVRSSVLDLPQPPGTFEVDDSGRALELVEIRHERLVMNESEVLPTEFVERRA